MYFKITNKKENHHGFQYVDGLNVLEEEFNNDPDRSCCAGGLYFTNAANIFKFLEYGVYLREVTLPTDTTDFLMIKDKDGSKWRANMIILGKRYELYTVDTFKYLIECGAYIHADNDLALIRCAKKGYLDVVKYLVDNGANIHAGRDHAIQLSAKKGHLSVVKYLVESGADVWTDNNLAIRFSADAGHLSVVEYLVKQGSDIHACDNAALRYSANNGHLPVVKYLVELGANIHADDDFALRCSAANGHTDVHEFLKSKCL